MKSNSVNFRRITDLLRCQLGDPQVLHQVSPLSRCASATEVLIATIITQATNDRNALKAWENFKNSFASLEQVLLVTESELAMVIRAGGLGQQKAKTIQTVLRILAEQSKDFSLEKLKKDPQQIWKFLNSIPGIGVKTAACTMLFGLKLPAFPVDIHINRIAGRTGWVPASYNPVQTQEFLTPLVPFELAVDLHILLLNLGRFYCKPHKANCGECPLTQDCAKFSINPC